MKIENNITPNIAQSEALEVINGSTQDRHLVVLPSGVGKTIFSAFATKDFDGKILYLVHRNEILDQAANEFKKIHTDITDNDIGFYRNIQKELGKKIIFSNVSTIGRIQNLGKINRKYFDYIILDEYHHSAAPLYQRIIKYFKPKKFLAMTATPYRMDQKDIFDDIGGEVSYEMKLQDAMDQGLLVPFKYFGLNDNINYNDIEWNGYKYKEADLDKKLLIKERDRSIIKEVKQRLGARKGIGFCCSIKHVNRMVARFNKVELCAAGITCDVDPDQRRRIMNDFKNGHIQFIFTRDIFNEGVNFPRCEALLFLRPTYSKTVFFQQLGRGLRKYPGKKDVIVLDFVGNYKNAYRIKEWLLAGVISENPRDVKPIHNHDVSEVWFDDRLLDIFELQKQANKVWTKEELIKIYKDLKEKLKRPPGISDLEKYTTVTASIYKSKWGQWSIFKKEMGDPTSQHFTTKEATKKEFIDYIKKHGSLPKHRDWTKHGLHSYQNIRRYFGNLKNFYDYIGIKYVRKKNVSVTKEQLIKDYYKVKKIVGKKPSILQLTKHVDGYSFLSWVNKFYKNYSNFLKSIGEPYIKPVTKTPTKKELIDNYNEVKKKLGKQQLLEKELNHKNGKYPGCIYRKVFGSMPEFRKIIGEEISIHPFTDSDIEIIKRDFHRLGPDIHALLKTHPRNSIYQKARQLGLTKKKKKRIIVIQKN